MPRISRRTALKAVAATSGSIALFSGAARATDDSIEFDVECIGDEVKVTLKKLVQSDGDRVDPTDPTVRDLRVVFGKKYVIDRSDDSMWNNGVIDRKAEIVPCVEGADPDDPATTSWCRPVAYADSESANTEVGEDGSSLVFTFERSDAGLDSLPGATAVVLAGLYDAVDDDRDPASFDGTRTFSPTTCCIECESDEELVGYEWNGNEFVVEGDGDEHIELTGVTEDEDGEPTGACFDVEYCEVDAVVKAGTEHETYEKVTGDVCVSGIETTNPAGKAVTHAISNVRFYCEAPEDAGAGNGRDDRNDSWGSV